MSVASKELMERTVVTGVITSTIGIVLGMAITSWIGAYQARKSALPRPAPAPWDYQ
jgi:ABC-type lipoprotein release transport system permease subunit